jgi:hypothetical protein
MILDLFIGVLSAWIFGRARKKMNMPTKPKHYIGAVIVVFVVLAIIYGASGHVSH